MLATTLRLGAVALAVCISSQAAAQTYPLRPLNADVPLSAPAPVFAPMQPDVSLPTRQPGPGPAPVADDVMTMGSPPSAPIDLTDHTSSTGAVVNRPAPTEQETQVGMEFSGEALVVDGNTIVVARQTIVLNGADAPELGQLCTDATGLEWRCGERAATHLTRLIGGNPVVCVGVEDLAGAVAATCKTGGTDYAVAMIRDGYALSFPWAAQVGKAEEATARSHRTGIWSGSFIYPWDFRKAGQ